MVEFLDRIVPAMDREVADEMHKTLEKQGMSFRLGTKVTAAKLSKSGVTLTVEPAAGGESEPIECDVVLSAIGRRPFTSGLGLGRAWRSAGSTWLYRGRRSPFRRMSPESTPVGDVIPGPMLAHKAEDEGVVAVEMMGGQAGHIDYNAIPAVVFTAPEVASVGRTEEQLTDDGIRVSRRQVSLCGKLSGPRVRNRHGWVCKDPGRRQDRSSPWRPYHRARCRDNDCGVGVGNGIFGLSRGYRPDLSRPPDAQ